MNKTIKNMTDIQALMIKIRSHPEIYAVMSRCTHMPFVYCDPETYDDEVFIYFSEEDARQGIQWLTQDGHPIQLARIGQKNKLDFFTDLYPAGVNCICVNRMLDGETKIQLEDLIRRADGDSLPAGHVRIENPQFHLTALYFTQELRKSQVPVQELSEEMKELDEELCAHFRRGKYLVALEEGKGIPILKKDGNAYLPVFTDSRDFQKFNREKKFSAAAVEYDKISQFMPKEADGVVVNPFGINVVFKIARQIV